MADNSNTKTHSPAKRPRRDFLRTMLLAGGFVGAAMLGLVPVLKGWVKRLRPPGALLEKDFLASCIKCGQCVQVCPVEAIKIADAEDGAGLGTPYIDSRAQACDFSCDGLQCVLACPTGALTHHIDYPHQARMATARIVHPQQCLAVKGLGFKGMARGPDFSGKLRYAEIDRWNPIELREHPYDLEICDLCVRQCPIEIRIAQCDDGQPPAGDPNQCPPEHAIRFVSLGDGAAMTPEILDGCVGCGVCEMVCPVEPGVIEMDVEGRGVMA